MAALLVPLAATKLLLMLTVMVVRCDVARSSIVTAVTPHDHLFRNGENLGTLLYMLDVNGQGLGIYAGDEPILIAARFCASHRLANAPSCRDVIEDHLCGGYTLLKCRSRRSLLAASEVVGFVHVAWEGEGGFPCAIGASLIKGDAERAPVVALSDKKDNMSVNVNPMRVLSELASERHNVYIRSLAQLHCTNLVRYHAACFCTKQVSIELERGLFTELERYRWSDISSHYAKLGIGSDAEHTEIRKAYRALSFVLHPDRSSAADSGGDTSDNGWSSEERIFMLNEAYEVLSDVHARSQYDRTLFGNRVVSEQLLPSMKAAVKMNFGPNTHVSVDLHGNIKISF